MRYTYVVSLYDHSGLLIDVIEIKARNAQRAAKSAMVHLSLSQAQTIETVCRETNSYHTFDYCFLSIERYKIVFSFNSHYMCVAVE